MPEGPEVTILRENLDKELKGCELLKIKITSTSRYREKCPDNFTSFEEKLPVKIVNVNSRGKLIYWKFSNGFYMLNTLGMSGGWTKKRDQKHTSLEFYYKDNKGKKKVIYFVDVRHFGTVKFLKSEKDLCERLKKLGPDILGKEMNFTVFKTRLQKYKKCNITKALMDQKIISGIGNYLKSESLYSSKISPLRNVESLSEKELYNLYQACRKKAAGSYNTGGVSVKDFSDIDDKKGQFQFQFEVYGRKFDNKKRKIERIVTPDKRSTFWVPEVQK